MTSYLRFRVAWVYHDYISIFPNLIYYSILYILYIIVSWKLKLDITIYIMILYLR